MKHKEIGCAGVGWFHVSQGMVRWRAVVSTVMNLQFHKRWEIS